MHRVDPARLDLAREFKSNPTGPHSPELQASSKPLLGYTDIFSVENGRAIAFKVSSALPGHYRAEIVRLRCTDHTGIGLQQTPVATGQRGVCGALSARLCRLLGGSGRCRGFLWAMCDTAGIRVAYDTREGTPGPARYLGREQRQGLCLDPR